MTDTLMAQYFVVVTVYVYAAPYAEGRPVCYRCDGMSPVEAMARAYTLATAVSPIRIANVMDWQWVKA